MEKILIKNGLIYDPLTKRKEIGDIAIAGSQIVDPGDFDFPLVIDAAGCLVVPGLIDFHLHCFSAVSDVAVDADILCLPNGVTTCVDAGTAGTAGFESCYRQHVCSSITTIKALLHVAPGGLVTARHPENQAPGVWDGEAVRLLVKKYLSVIVGLKVRMSASVLEPFHLSIEPLAEAVSLAEELRLPVVVHVNDPNVEIGAITSLLRGGDVFCHMYAGEEKNILDSGMIKAEIHDARKRGVIFDACNGKNNFLFQVAFPAIKQGFLPDIISSDLNRSCVYRQPVISLPRLLSKYLALGMDLYDVIDTVTINPARWLGVQDMGTLRKGTVADVALFKVEEKQCTFFDCHQASVQGNQVLVPQLTIKDGTVVYCQSDFL
ncbi:MAG: amidohydrolase family protein [Treponema sp.]|nr:amidohydrolase family protein [Treponema sp.]